MGCLLSLQESWSCFGQNFMTPISIFRRKGVARGRGYWGGERYPAALAGSLPRSGEDESTWTLRRKRKPLCDLTHFWPLLHSWAVERECVAVLIYSDLSSYRPERRRQIWDKPKCKIPFREETENIIFLSSRISSQKETCICWKTILFLFIYF